MRRLKAGAMNAKEMVSIRTRMGMTQEEFARRLQLSTPSISKFERGARIRLTTAYAARFAELIDQIEEEKRKEKES